MPAETPHDCPHLTIPLNHQTRAQATAMTTMSRLSRGCMEPPCCSDVMPHAPHHTFLPIPCVTPPNAAVICASRFAFVLSLGWQPNFTSRK